LPEAVDREKNAGIRVYIDEDGKRLPFLRFDEVSRTLMFEPTERQAGKTYVFKIILDEDPASYKERLMYHYYVTVRITGEDIDGDMDGDKDGDMDGDKDGDKHGDKDGDRDGDKDSDKDETVICDIVCDPKKYVLSEDECSCYPFPGLACDFAIYGSEFETEFNCVYWDDEEKYTIEEISELSPGELLDYFLDMTVQGAVTLSTVTVASLLTLANAF